MPATKSITNSRGYFPSESVWIDTMKRDVKGLIWGRIQDTGVNYIVEGYREVRRFGVGSHSLQENTGCSTPSGSVMPKNEFAIHRELKDINNGQ